MSTLYCPYTDLNIPLSDSNIEHIIPLSLGGSNQFTINVQREANSTLGSKIDGKLASDFLVLFQREKFDARGHSDKSPAPLIKKAKDSNTGKPLQVTMGKQLKIWDAIEEKYQPLQGQKIEASLTLNIDLPLQFVAKTALAAGYFVYGDLFRNNVRHEDLRFIMNGPIGLSETQIKNVKTKVFSRFQYGLSPKNQIEFDTQKLLCESVRGSCVVFSPGKDSLGVYVGVLGHYLGMVNIPANTDKFPRFDEHDLGHAIFLIDGVMKRTSYRERLQQLYSQLT